MGRSTRLHARSSGRPAVLQVIRPLERREPNYNRVLVFGFLAIGAFMCGGGGYLAGVFSHVGLAGHTVAALLAFLLARRSMEAP